MHTSITCGLNLSTIDISRYKLGLYLLLCFLQDDLDEVVTTWNSHTISTKAGHGVIGGCPILMYTLPQMYGGEDKVKTIDMGVGTPKGQYPCDETVFELCCLLMEENGLDAPQDAFSTDERLSCEIMLLLLD